jgi:SAM-dependent methyltransferase
MIQRADWSGIAHQDMPFMGPYGERHLEEALVRLHLPPNPRAVDLGCGSGAVLEHLARTRGATGVGIDTTPVARTVNGISFVRGDATAYRPPELCDLAISIGSVGTPALLGSLIGSGGSVLWGEGYWRQEPDPAFLALLGAGRDDLDSLEGMVGRGEAAGLVALEPVVSSDADWDRYEDSWANNGERFAAAHRGEPGVEAFLAWIRAGRSRYRESGGRETLGFALMPFIRAA